MKRSIFTILLLVCTVSAFSQKAVRDSLRVGNEAYRQKQYTAAESKYKAAMNMNPMEKMAVYNLGNTYFKQGKWDESIKEYENYLNMEMENAADRGAALHNMGNAYLKKKDLKKALEVYKEALRNNPSDDQTRYNLAVVQKILQDQDKKKNQDQDKDKKNQQDDKKKQDQKDQNKPQDQDKDKDKDKPKPKEPDQNQMSSDNIEQILKSLEQEEKATQQRVQDRKNNANKILNGNNRRQNKDW